MTGLKCPRCGRETSGSEGWCGVVKYDHKIKRFYQSYHCINCGCASTIRYRYQLYEESIEEIIT